MAKKSIGVRIIKNDIKRLKKAMPEKAERALTALAELGVNHAKEIMLASPATGQQYSRASGNKTHTASSPGNPPRPDTGTLLNSIRQMKTGRLGRVIVDGVLYGYYLEFGTVKMAARPFFTPTAQWLSGQVPMVFDNFLEGAV